MKTFKSEKHSIPEGATHHGVYGCDTDCYFKKDGETYLLWKDENWSLSHFDHHRWVKPITQPTYRYEKVELSPKEVFMAMLNGESFYVLKDELIDFDGEQFWRHTSEGKSRITYINHDHEIYRRIEVTERELFIEAYASAFNTHMLLVEDVAGTLFDSGKFKLVNGKG